MDPELVGMLPNKDVKYDPEAAVREYIFTLSQLSPDLFEGETGSIDQLVSEVLGTVQHSLIITPDGVQFRKRLQEKLDMRETSPDAYKYLFCLNLYMNTLPSDMDPVAATEHMLETVLGPQVAFNNEFEPAIKTVQYVVDNSHLRYTPVERDGFFRGFATQSAYSLYDIPLPETYRQLSLRNRIVHQMGTQAIMHYLTRPDDILLEEQPK